MKVSDVPVLNKTIPAKHMDIRLVRAPETYLLGSRGSFKTTVGIVLYMIDCIYDMPRHTGVIVVPNYEHFDINTLPPLLKGFKEFGFYSDVHFVVGKRPPEKWPRAYDYDASLDFKRIITWHNGTQYIVVSLARLGASNAISAQSGVFDEVKLMKKDKLDEVLPIFRGNKKYFDYTSNLYSKFFATDKLADPAEIQWLLNKRQQVDRQKVTDVRALQIEVNRLKAELDPARRNKYIAAQKSILEYEALLRKARSGMVYVQEINCYDVRALLGEEWFNAAKAQVKNERVWKVAYENIDPDRPEESFYPSFQEKIHLYETADDEDIDWNESFIIAADYQHSVAPVPVAQISRLPGEEDCSLNYVDFCYTLYPQTLKKAVSLFCEKYDRSTKNVFYVYDHTAIGRRVDADSYDKIVRDTLISYGWNVNDIYIGEAPEHFNKYTHTDEWLKHTNPDTLDIRLNKRCGNLITSILNSGTKIERGVTKKEKKFENTARYPDIDQSTTTHGSDAFDMINEAVLGQKLITAGSGYGGGIFATR